MKWDEMNDGLEDGFHQQYIAGGNYGIMGVPGEDNWYVVHASDGVRVGHRMNTPDTYESARQLAETMQEND